MSKKIPTPWKKEKIEMCSPWNCDSVLKRWHVSWGIE
jgi:hypothetical protein